MANTSTRKRQILQWSLLWLVIITIGLGWKFPLLGYIVPAVMLTGMVCSLIHGRYACGNLCPRGAFLDRLIAPVSAGNHIPSFFRTPCFRWLIFAALMGFMLYRGLRNPADPLHWGRVFWVMCVITTTAGGSSWFVGAAAALVRFLSHGHGAKRHRWWQRTIGYPW